MVFAYSEGDKHKEEAMTIHLTPEQERRVHAVLGRGSYQSVEEVVEAALAAVEQGAVLGFSGTPEELEALLAEGMTSRELTEDQFWDSVNAQTDGMLAGHENSSPS
jgi:Arc/MetJ-type ribon-helix-helix transcriptional regulator